MSYTWMSDAACAGMDLDLFMDPSRTREARAVCGTCPVVSECLEYAVQHRVPGVVGGRAEHQRRHLHRKTR